MRFCSIVSSFALVGLGRIGLANGQEGPPPFSPEIFYLLTGIPTLVSGTRRLLFSRRAISRSFASAPSHTLFSVLKEYETPLATRFANNFDNTWWNCVAAYSSDFKDALTKERPLISSPDIATHNTTSRAACVVQATASLNDLWFGGNDAYLQAMQNNVPPFLPVPYIEPEIDAGVKNCGSDNACLLSIAEQGNFDPTIMGHIIAQQTFTYGLTDGFNQLGTDAGCSISCRPYSDTTGYEPLQRGPDSWKPLVESNGKGFFYFQEFVTPHIGQTATFRYLPESERATRVVRPPNYSNSRNAEANQVISQMALLDDISKVEIETFDDKLYVAVTIIEAFVNKMIGAGMAGYVDGALGQEGYFLSFERLLHFTQGLTAAEYDSIIIAWKEKVEYSLVRPTTVIKERGDATITTWAPGGVQSFAAKDFEAYIRVMPHAEYTSGSSCLLITVEEYVTEYLTALGLDASFPVKFPTMPQGSSKVEPGVVPASDVTLEYGSIAEMSAAGCISRFNGGMHFYDSVPAGIELCSGIAQYTVQGSNALIDGIF